MMNEMRFMVRLMNPWEVRLEVVVSHCMFQTRQVMGPGQQHEQLKGEKVSVTSSDDDDLHGNNDHRNRPQERREEKMSKDEQAGFRDEVCLQGLKKSPETSGQV